ADTARRKLSTVLESERVVLSRIPTGRRRTATRLLLESELFRFKKGSHTNDLHTRPTSPNI
ncbi:hypothetical protein JG687_00018930, partial [Phytophthora cactorum]